MASGSLTDVATSQPRFLIAGGTGATVTYRFTRNVNDHVELSQWWSINAVAFIVSHSRWVNITCNPVGQ